MNPFSLPLTFDCDYDCINFRFLQNLLGFVEFLKEVLERLFHCLSLYVVWNPYIFTGPGSIGSDLIETTSLSKGKCSIHPVNFHELG